MAKDNSKSESKQKMFDSDPKNPPQKQSDQGIENLSKKIVTIGSRLRVIEERYTTVRKKIQLSDENMLEFEKELRTEFKSLSAEFLDLKRIITDMNDNLVEMSAEMNNTIKSSEFKTLQKYVEIWQPMNFVTRDELKKILQDFKNDEL